MSKNESLGTSIIQKGEHLGLEALVLYVYSNSGGVYHLTPFGEIVW